MDFVRLSPDPNQEGTQNHPQSCYKSDFASPNSLKNSQKVFGRASNQSFVSLTGTNIRGSTNGTSDRYDQQRWTSKVIEKKASNIKPRSRTRVSTIEKDELDRERISKLSIDQALEQLQREKVEGTRKDPDKRSPIL
jgi:hypothetical protein